LDRINKLKKIQQDKIYDCIAYASEPGYSTQALSAPRNNKFRVQNNDNRNKYKKKIIIIIKDKIQCLILNAEKHKYGLRKNLNWQLGKLA
jgi:hypothetical protein